MSGLERSFPPDIPQHQRGVYQSMLHAAEVTAFKVRLPDTVIVAAEDEQIPDKVFLGLIGIEYVDSPDGRAVQTGTGGAKLTILEMNTNKFASLLNSLDYLNKPYPVIMDEKLLPHLLSSLDQIAPNHYRYTRSNLSVIDFYIVPRAVIYETEDPNISVIGFPEQETSSN